MVVYRFMGLCIRSSVGAFFGHYVNPRITPAAQGGAAGSVRLLLTKNPARSLNYPGCRVRGVSFEGISRPGRQLA